MVGLFALCVSLKLNGSSIGVWQKVLNEPGPIRGLLLFKPEEVRADEWSHITPSIIAQARHSPRFPIENESLGAGRSPLLMSVPIAYYTTIFRPQLWGFFFLDLERAFSFYWCFKVFALPLATAWLLRQLGIQSAAIVIFGTTWLFFSSFVQWWFSSPAMLPEMLACSAIVTGCALNFFRKASRPKLALLVAAFVFFGVNFVLCLYPGFQVPLLYVSAAILVGLWLARSSGEEWRMSQGLFLFAGGLLLIAIILVPFWRDVSSTLELLAQTSYPGVIRNTGGGLSVFDLFSGVLGFFESEQRTPAWKPNICEASNFYPLWLPALADLSIGRWKEGARTGRLVAALAAVIFALAIYCVVPMPHWLVRLSLLGLGPERRLLLGIGIANILLGCLYFYSRPAIAHSGRVGLLVGAAVLTTGLLWFRPFPDNERFSIFVVVINATIVVLFFWHRAQRWFLAIFLGLVVINGAAINPVMRGLSPILDSEAFRKIDKWRAVDPTARWMLYENASCAQLVKATGAIVFNGVKILPDLNFMRQLDPRGQYRSIYNRFAYINVGLPEDRDEIVFSLNAANSYQFTLSPEHPALRANGYRYLVFPRPWLNAALHAFTFADQIEPGDLYIYKLQIRNEE